MLSAKIIKKAQLVYKDAPHGMCTTLKDKVNADRSPGLHPKLGQELRFNHELAFGDDWGLGSAKERSTKNPDEVSVLGVVF